MTYQKAKQKQIKQYLQANKWLFWLLTLLALLLFMGLCFLVLQEKDSNGIPKKMNTQYQLNWLKEQSKELKKDFSLLLEKEVEKGRVKNNEIVLVEYLYLKNPYIKSAKLKAQLYRLNEALKQKYNDSGKKIKLIEYRIYDRKIIFEKNLPPRNVSYYYLDSTPYLKQQSKEEEQEKKILNKENDSKVNTVAIPLRQLVIQKTLDSKKINYKNYRLEIDKFHEISSSNSKKTLSNEEFALFLKLELYKAITKNIISAIDLLLKWDFAKDMSEKDSMIIAKEFEQFYQRAKENQQNSNFYPNFELLKAKLAIYRPQLLLFALQNKREVNREAAQKKLQVLYPELKKVLQNHLEIVSQHANKYGGINWYLNDPFEKMATNNKDKTVDKSLYQKVISLETSRSEFSYVYSNY